MTARAIDHRKVRVALLADVRFNHPEAAAISSRYTPRLIRLSQRRVAEAVDVTYIDILWLQIALGLEALANGYPHLPKSDEQQAAVDSLKSAIAKQQRELGRLPKVSHENVEFGNLAAILNPSLIKILDNDLKVSFKDFIEKDPGCVLSILVTPWLR